jgi:uncharacterized protein (DUF983 family)
MEAGGVCSKFMSVKETGMPNTFPQAAPSWTEAFMRGMKRQCPRCGRGKMFAGYLTPRVSCQSCGLAFEPLRADDAPAYFTVFIVGHVIISGVLLTEQLWHPEMWLQFLWLPASVAMMGGMLPYVKGAVMGAIFSSRAGEHTFPAE